MITIMRVNTVIMIVARPSDKDLLNLSVGSAVCALASWTSTNMTARQSKQYTVDLTFAIMILGPTRIATLTVSNNGPSVFASGS